MRCFSDQRETGASLVEYALLVALVAVVCIAGVRKFGESVTLKQYYNTYLINHGTANTLPEDCESAADWCLNLGDAAACEFIEGGP